MAQALALAAVIVLSFLAGPAPFLSACVAVILWLSASSPAERALAVTLPIAFLLALALGAFHFESPVQIVDLAMRDIEPLAMFLQQDLWWPRYLVAYPAILVTDHWGLRFADGFAYYCSAILPASAMVLLAALRLWRRMDELRAFAVGLGFAVLVAAIATQMNGRLIPAHIGIGVIILGLARIVMNGHVGIREGLLLAIGVVLSHMTTGTGLVAFAVLVAGVALIISLRIERSRMLGLLWVLSVLFGPLLFGDLLKNLDYYGGGFGAFVTMLDHGPGIFLRRQPWVVPLALFAVLVVLAVVWRFRARLAAIPRALWPEALAVPVTGVGGLYGFSTLSMGLPPLLILLMSAAVAWSSRPRAA